MVTKKYRSKQFGQSEEELSKKLIKIMLGIIGLIVFVILALFVFAPTFGSAFGLLSKNRNAKEEAVTVRIRPPTLTNVPASTKDTKINLAGYANEGETIKLFVNGPEVAQTTTGADGIFNFISIELIKGRNTIFAKAINAKNEESGAGETFTILLDTEQPKIEITFPKDESTVRNLDKRITITGTINEKATLKINGRMVIQKPDLSFEYTLGVKSGDVEIKVEATDEAGNTNEETITVKYQETS
ncbi:MAG: hypothetical protein UU64_C0002G0007 [candidate division WWE3 bacterium GW2011_GWF2_41_45]|uniref:Bacterial Ig-like domain-containing protein n=3 Tax=Katanobacteria TaxID=422282 RepID=A0A1F4W4C5_UNCKA|nr:MAG: hypothetical protein UU55_C0017G0007 [candidate division WWE3 bacterium GW2011_GWC2_41_23]KKS10605.1 MAG: hypothetical protein UU64_C0002G0007 [candidate division WWE3 bacterium GW2011_GWF2_41_45]KKS12384.1 MAG: hypothetical protein UU68_C0002G0110 [candidate division WWE3 bacterium GW2011_GWF1_41_53]KKS20458.1 MAG: hypothetical protein UU79_C0001G0112 [candidate division WWE3 bacterium GW2011_GWE1_41_72]KKS27272.1 MAG: hypothetical protein UU86_C0022G0007 [candidate division WWE3 bacte